MGERAAIYTRVSQDRDGTEQAVTRQREDADALIQQRGWEFVIEYRENDTSAAGKKARPKFRAMLAAVERGEIDVIVAWALDRLTRTARDRLALVEACRDHGVKIALVRGSDMDPSTPSGRLAIGVLGEVAQHEIDSKGDRQRRAAAQRVSEGRAGNAGGGRRPFGYLAGGVVVDPVEGPAVEEAATRFLSGDSLRGIALDFNRRGLLTTTGAQWTATTIGQMLARPRNAGLIGSARHGSKPGEVSGPAKWPAVIERDVWERVCRKLADPARRTQHSTSRRLLGSFLYRCGGCGAPLRSGGRGSSGQDRYTCSGPRPCLRRSAELIDLMVREVIAELLVVITLPQREGANVRAEHARLAALIARREELDADYADAVSTRASYRDMAARNERQQVELREVIRRAEEISPLAGVADADDAGTAFRSADVDRQRAIIATLADVAVMPVPPGRRPFDPASVEITPKVAARGE